jgi:hypothetical protein
MATNLSEVVDTVRHLLPAEQREVLARLWPEQALAQANTVWTSVRFSDRLRVVAYAPEQEPYVDSLRTLLLRGALARRESEADGSYEIYGPDRTYYVTMTPAREFAALLSSWLPDHPPREVELQDT